MKYLVLASVLTVALAGCAHAPGSGPAEANPICVAPSARVGDILKGARYDHATGTLQPFYFEVVKIAGEKSAAERAFGGLVIGTACADAAPVSAWSRPIPNQEAERRLAAAASAKQ